MNKKPTNFSGVITALVTPFQHGEVDFKSLEKLVKRQLDDGVNGFVVNGTTAESPTLTTSEVEKIFAAVKGQVAGAVPLILGTGTNATRSTVEMTKLAGEWGAAAALTVVPYYNRPPQRGLIEHFQAVARASQIPILLYNVPSRTVSGLDASTVGTLSRVDRIVGIKEATGNMDLLAEMRRAAVEDFTFLSGDDLSCVRFCADGGHGVISVSSHLIASSMSEAIAKARARDRGADGAYRERFGDFMKWLYIEANPIPVKMALHWQGILASPELRLPLVALDSAYHKEFQSCLKKLALL